MEKRFKAGTQRPQVTLRNRLSATASFKLSLLAARSPGPPDPCYDLQLETRDIATSATDTSRIINRNAGR